MVLAIILLLEYDPLGLLVREKSSAEFLNSRYVAIPEGYEGAVNCINQKIGLVYGQDYKFVGRDIDFRAGIKEALKENADDQRKFNECIGHKT